MKTFLARFAFELALYDVTVQQIHVYDTWNPVDMKIKTVTMYLCVYLKVFIYFFLFIIVITKQILVDFLFQVCLQVSVPVMNFSNVI